VALLAGCADRCVEHQVFHPEPARGLIVCFGDSITSGAVGPTGYVTLLQKRLPGRTVVGAGVNGNTVRELLDRIDRDVIARNPETVVVEIGVNDAQLIRPTEFQRGLCRVVDKLHANNARVILCTLALCGEKTDRTNPIDERVDQFAAIARRVASDKQVTLCDLRKACLDYLKEHNAQNAARGVLTQTPFICRTRAIGW
jgi:lysophospholipase L1-like esterase